MSFEPNTATVASESVATIPLSTDFCADDADVIIRAQGALDFRVHKCNLSLVSPVFKDMFTIPQPPTDTPGLLPHVDVQDPPEAWENILRTIYPMPNPVMDNLDDLEPLLLTAKKYEMDFVIDSYTQCFENPSFIRRDPLRLYTIACTGGFEEEAKYVASHAKLLTVVERSSIDNLECLTLGSYHRLVSFLVKRDKKWRRILADAAVPHKLTCDCESETVYDMIREDLETPDPSTDEIYMKALEHSLIEERGAECDGGCALMGSAIRGFIDLLGERKDAAVNSLMW